MPEMWVGGRSKSNFLHGFRTPLPQLWDVAVPHFTSNQLTGDWPPSRKSSISLLKRIHCSLIMTFIYGYTYIRRYTTYTHVHMCVYIYIISHFWNSDYSFFKGTFLMLLIRRIFPISIGWYHPFFHEKKLCFLLGSKILISLAQNTSKWALERLTQKLNL